MNEPGGSKRPDPLPELDGFRARIAEGPADLNNDKHLALLVTAGSSDFASPQADWFHGEELNEMLRISVLEKKVQSDNHPEHSVDGGHEATPKKTLSLLEKLPDELLVEIFGILFDNRRYPDAVTKQPALAALSQTSRSLKGVADEVLYKEINLDHPGLLVSRAVALANPQLAALVKILSWNICGECDCPTSALYKIVRALPNLQVLTYDSCDPRHFERVATRLMKNQASSMKVNQFALLSLRKLHVSEITPFHLSFLFRMPSLEELFCRVTIGNSSPDDWVGTEKSSGIRHLDINGRQCLVEVLRHIVLAVKSLKTLVTSQWMLPRNALASHQQSLEKLKIECRIWDDLKSLNLHKFPNLRALSIKEFFPLLPLSGNRVFAQLLPVGLEEFSVRIYGREENSHQYFKALMALKEHHSLVRVIVRLEHEFPQYIRPMPYKQLKLSTVTLALAKAGIMVRVYVQEYLHLHGFEWKPVPLQLLKQFESLPGPEGGDTDSDDQDAGADWYGDGMDLG